MYNYLRFEASKKESEMSQQTDFPVLKRIDDGRFQAVVDLSGYDNNINQDILYARAGVVVSEKTAHSLAIKTGLVLRDQATFVLATASGF